MLQHCQNTGFNEGFSYRVIDSDLIIEPLMKMILILKKTPFVVWLMHTHKSKVAHGICNLPSGAPVPLKCTDTPWLCLWGCESNRFSSFLLFSIDEHVWNFLLSEWCPPVPHLVLVPSFSFMHSLSDLFHSALSLFCFFLALYHLFRFLF